MRDLELSLLNLQKCTHPGVEGQIEDLERRLVWARRQAHAVWPSGRQLFRLGERSRTTQEDLEKAEKASITLARLSLEGEMF